MATGKSEKQQVIAFIDYENCSNLTEISLNIYTELIIFAGAKQNNVALPVNAFPEAVKITLRHVSEVSRNNVDFHLVLELGQCVCHYGPEKEYHIVSADKGYDGIVRTLQARGIRCRRVSPDKASSVKMAAPDMDIVIRWANKIQQAAREVRNMPVTEKTFNNYLKSHMRDEWNKTRAVAIRNELVRRGVTEVREKKIIWKKAKKENKA
ncbi:hypothetical protein DNQ45_18675 [Escherichia coli]|uniref:PIN-like domain-containing protein n=1 Tax=Escherichia coli TaxID=562 RepID=A0A2W6PAA1_ECOLX|nr:hypothetical protein DNQ45_18675 [Escherichia coli]